MCEKEILRLDSLKKFDDFIEVLSFYHVKRCEHEDCSQCLFVVNLRYLYVEHFTQELEITEPLRNYCRLRCHQFMCARFFIHHLANLEKQRVALEKEFHNTLKIWKYTKQEQLPPPDVILPQTNTKK